MNNVKLEKRNKTKQFIDLKLNKGNYIEKINEFRKYFFPGIDFYNGEYENDDGATSYIFLRGESNFDWKLVPKLNRKGYKRKKESEILLKYNKNKIIDKKKLIAMAQHYGEATRTIDFTFDINVALFFACYNEEEWVHDGAIYLFAYAPHKIDYKSAYVFNTIALMNENKISTKELSIKLINDDGYLKTFNDKEKDWNDKIDKNNIRQLDIENVYVDYSSYLHTGFLTIYNLEDEKENERIKKQKGVLFYCGSKFSLCKNDFNEKSNINYCNEKIKSMGRYAESYNIYLHKFINPQEFFNKEIIKIRIPKELKENILKSTHLTKKLLGL